jgi:glycosyltransferase involved in cell wall biosynthesis
VYLDFLNDLKNQDCEFDFEIISLPNFNGEYDSCSRALNVGMALSESEYIMMCHQDLRVPNNWLSNIFEKIRELIINDIKFGVLGMAGAWVHKQDSDGIIFLDGSTNTDKFKEVQCLDELCLIIKNGTGIKFDESNFPHFHGYGSDFCLSYIRNGYRNFAINCPCIHLSDGFKNLVHPEQLDMFIKNSLTLHKKWRNIIPEFRNMTAKFSRIENSITFYVADELNNRGISMKKHVVLSD